MTTNKQKENIRFCEDWLKITFKGNCNSQRSVSRFLSKYLKDAENAEREAIEFYYNNFDH